MQASLSLLVFTLLIGGCGYAALPGPTQKNVTKADIVGVWQYLADFRKTTVTLDLETGGTFVQTIKRSGQTKAQVHTGNWGFEGVTPKLTVLRPVFGLPGNPWVLEEAHWWIVDSWIDEDKFAIFWCSR